MATFGASKQPTRFCCRQIQWCSATLAAQATVTQIPEFQLSHRSAFLIDQIRKRANAADLAIGEPTDFERQPSI
jgi:hypothetical protein